MHWATTGGSTPAGNLSQPRHAAPSGSRAVGVRRGCGGATSGSSPPDHPLSNAKIALSDLLEIGALSGQSGTGGSGVDVTGRRTAGAPIPAENVHPIPDRARRSPRASGPSGPPSATSKRCRPRARRPTVGWPAFDLVLLGIGPDGHVLSVFPGSETFDREEVGAGRAGADACRAARRRG